MLRANSRVWLRVLVCSILVLRTAPLWAADTVAEPIVFPAVTNAEPGRTVISDSQTIAGIDASVPISVSGGAYSINGGAFTTASGRVVNGDAVRVSVVSSGAFYTSASAKLKVGSPSASSTFKVTTRKADTVPDAFSFAPRIEAALGSVQTSEPTTISGLEAAAAISVGSGGSYSIDGGPFTTVAGTVANHAQVRARGTASATANKSVSVTVRIGGINGTFKITTVKTADTTPDAFSFAPTSNAAPGSVQTSTAIVVSGINTGAPISVTGGSYSIDGGAFVTTAGTVTAGQTVRVQQTASNAANTTTTATLTIGGVGSGFAVTTAAVAVPGVSINDVSVVEGNSGTVVARFTFRLSAPTSQTVTVRFATASATASAGNDYLTRTGTTTFAPGETSKTQPFTVNGDLDFEPDETFVVNLSAPVGLTIEKAQGVATIVNDDPAPDTKPDPFGFDPTLDAPLGSPQSSHPITVTGLTAPSPISIAGGYYSIDGGAFTDASGSVGNGATVVVQVLAAYGYSETRTATLDIGGVAGTYSVTTRTFTADGTPDAFHFQPVVDAPVGSLQRSQPIVVGGIDVAVPITVNGGRYQVNDGAFTAEPGEVSNGDRVTAEVQAAETDATTRTATLVIGGVSADFSATTARNPIDIDPDAFAFAPVVNVEPGSLQTSQPVMMTGISAGTPIAVVGGRYSINGGEFTAISGVVASGDSVAAEVIASADFAAGSEAVLTVGTASAAFQVTTRPADATPDAFAFAPIVDAVPGSIGISAAVTISGIDVPVAVSITGGTYSIGNAPFTSDPGEVRNGDAIRVRTSASAKPATTTAATLTIAGISAVFDITTSSADITPDPFSFNGNPSAFPLLAAVSAPITVSGIDAPITASVVGGEYSVNGAAFMSVPGPVSNGDRIRLLVTPGANRGDTRTATLNLGGVVGSFTVTADAPVDDFPDIFEFRETIGPRNAIVRSETSVIRGINVATPISVVGGSYSINGGPFGSAASTVRGGDQVTLQANSGSSHDAQVRVTLDIGSRSTVWSLRTESDPTKLQAFTLVNASMFAGGAVVPGSVQTTVPITVYNPSSPTAISVSGGSYSVNGGSFTPAAGTVVSGDSVVVQFTASTSYDTPKSATLRIGAFSSTLSVTTTVDPVAATPTSATDCSSHIFRQQAPVPLRIFVCKPAGWRSTDRRSALVHWFGGGFIFGNVDSSVGEARYWARNHGMVGIAPDYRVNDRFGTYAYLSADDGRAAVRWLQEHAEELGLDPARIALSGSSAGGGVAFFAAMREAPVTGSPADNPLLRPAAIVTRAGVPDITTESHIQAYKSADRFADLGSVISPSVHLDTGFPPVLLFHGDRDTTVAPTPSVHFCSSLIRLGIRCEYRNQAGAGHDLSVGANGLDPIREETRVFLTSLGLLPALP
ncbi:MAG: hypothetical protein C0434_11540 [Xanthomonadaceae bacterium]|nr:hypothetical protein [Xanthomonadaceae bacterium]